MLHEFCFNLKRKTVSSQGQAIVLTPAKDRPPPPATTLLSEMNPPHPLAPQLPRGPAVPRSHLRPLPGSSSLPTW